MQQQMPMKSEIDDSTALLSFDEPKVERVKRDSILHLKKNLSSRERLVSGLLGGTLLAYGLSRPSWLRGQFANLAGAGLLFRSISGHCPLYESLGVDRTPEGQATQKSLMAPHPYVLRETITIARRLEEVYTFCRDLSQASRYVPGLERIELKDDTQAQLSFLGKSEQTITCDIEIIEDIPDRQFSWRLLPEGLLSLSSSLRFQAAPHGRGTEVHIFLRVNPPAGALGTAFFKALSPFNRVLLSQTLHRLKQALETGEVASTEGQPSGRHIKSQALRHLQENVSQKLLEKSVQTLNTARNVL